VELNRTSTLMRWVVIVFVMGSFVGAQPAEALHVPGTPFFDDFSDLNLSDDMPVTWNPGPNTRQFASSEGLVIVSNTPPGGDVAGSFASHWGGMPTESHLAGLPTATFDDVSIRTQVRILTGDSGAGDVGGIGVSARSIVGGGLFYGAGISSDGFLSINLTTSPPIGPYNIDVLASTTTTLDVFSTDIHLQFDLFGDILSLTAWADGTPQPAIPQLTVVDTTLTESGFLGAGFTVESNLRTRGAFRFFEAVPEPSTALLLMTGLLGLAKVGRGRVRG